MRWIYLVNWSDGVVMLSSCQMTQRWHFALHLALTTMVLCGCGPKPVSTILHPDAAVVRIRGAAHDRSPATEGRGFIVSSDGFVVTCAQIVNGNRAVSVIMPDGRDATADLVLEDQTAGIAILKVSGKDLPALRLRDDEINPGLHVRVVGEGGITHGVFDHWENFGREIDFTARVGPNDCGSPLLADDGRVVGVVLGHFEDRPSASRAAPAWHISRMMPNLNAPSLVP
jgi:S1-C subfamily serine protease